MWFYYCTHVNDISSWKYHSFEWFCILKLKKSEWWKRVSCLAPRNCLFVNPDLNAELWVFCISRLRMKALIFSIYFSASLLSKSLIHLVNKIIVGLFSNFIFRCRDEDMNLTPSCLMIWAMYSAGQWNCVSQLTGFRHPSLSVSHEEQGTVSTGLIV